MVSTCKAGCARLLSWGDGAVMLLRGLPRPRIPSQVVIQPTYSGPIEKYEGIRDQCGLAYRARHAPVILCRERPSQLVQEQVRSLPGFTTIVRHMRSLQVRGASAELVSLFRCGTR